MEKKRRMAEDEEYEPKYREIDTTEDIEVPEKLVDQVIGQDKGVEVVRKAASQGRNVLLIGSPGTGKSMLAKAMSELLPTEELQDVLSFPNPDDPNEPKVDVAPAGEGEKIVEQKKKLVSNQKMSGMKPKMSPFLIMGLLYALGIGAAIYFNLFSDIILAAIMIVGGMLLAFLSFALALSSGLQGMQMPGKGQQAKKNSPKLLVDNSGEDKAPFVDATGARAGALLGDVKHDPFQSFRGSTEVETKSGEHRMDELVNRQFNKYPERIEENDIEGETYEQVILPEDQRPQIKDNEGYVDLKGVNRRDYQGDLIKITTESGKQLLVTPEHEVATSNGMKEASNIEKGDTVVSIPPKKVIDQDKIIETYSKDIMESAKSYYKYKELSAENPGWGYKKLSSELSIPRGRVRHWYEKKGKPEPIKCLEWVKEKNLLHPDKHKRKIATRITGALFGDGGIYSNNESLFFSSGKENKEDLNKFKEDLMELFGEGIEEDIHIREGGEYGESRHVELRKAKATRYFEALGIPTGEKVLQPIKIPEWIYSEEELKEEFFGALLGSEMGSPKVKENHIQGLEFTLCSSEEYKEELERFLNEVRRYLEEKDINTTEPHFSEGTDRKDGVHTIMGRVLISNALINVKKLEEKVPIRYCEYKKKRISRAIEEVKDADTWRYHEEEKKERAKELRDKGISNKKISEMIEVPASTVTNWLPSKKKRRVGAYGEEVKRKAIELHREGKSYSDINDEMDVPKSSIARFIQRGDVNE